MERIGEGGEHCTFSTRTKECNYHHSSHFGTLRGDAIIAQLRYLRQKLKVSPRGPGRPAGENCVRGILMKRLIRSAAMVLLVLAVTLAIAADKAKSLYNKGKDAEARQNYEQAYDYYKQAYELKPKDIGYRASYERTRFLAGASHVHRGQLLRDAGKLDEAIAEFRKAAEIDSASFIAQQELRRTQKMIDAANAMPTPQAEAPPRTGLQKRLDDAQGPV